MAKNTDLGVDAFCVTIQKKNPEVETDPPRLLERAILNYSGLPTINKLYILPVVADYYGLFVQPPP